MTPVRGIVFDKDGTLFDFEKTWGLWTGDLLAVLAQGDSALQRRLADVVGYDLDARRLRPESVIVAATTGDCAALITSAMPKGSALSDVVAIFDAQMSRLRNIEAVPLAPLLSGLAGRGLKLGLATNDTEAYAIAHLSEADVRAHFDFIAGYDSGHGAKPGPGQLLAFCAATGLVPDEVVMVGDSTFDLLAGRAAGMATVGVLTGTVGPEVLTPHADAILPDIGHLPAWLDRA